MKARDRIALLLSRQYIRRVSLGWIASLTFGGAYGGTAFFFPTFFHEVRGHTLEEANLIVACRTASARSATWLPRWWANS